MSNDGQGNIVNLRAVPGYVFSNARVAGAFTTANTAMIAAPMRAVEDEYDPALEDALVAAWKLLMDAKAEDQRKREQDRLL